MKTFVEAVRQRKAIERLLQNDAVFRSIAYRMSAATPEESVWIAVECATFLSDRIKDMAPQMDVSEKEKREGYSPSR
jgi:hypothetical protein